MNRNIVKEIAPNELLDAIDNSSLAEWHQDSTSDAKSLY